MPRIKRWFHASQDLNRDPEFREFAKKFGLGGVRFWWEALAILDRTDNYWNLHKGFDLGLLTGLCETKRHIIQGSFEHLKDINWLRVGIDPDQKLFIYAPKWAEYNQRREDKGSMLDTTRYQESTYPTPSPSPSPSPKKEIYKKKVPELDTSNEHFEAFWQAYPPRNGKKLGRPATLTLFLKLSLEDQLLAIQAAKNYSASEMVKAGIGIKDPNRFMRSGKSYEYWRDWIEPEQPKTGNDSATGCTWRIEVGGRLKFCGNPPTTVIGKTRMCQDCYQVYQKEQESLKQKGVVNAGRN